MNGPLVLELADGHAMPALGFGTWDLAAGAEAQGAVEAALAAGYRHIDTATLYGNEADCGAAIRASGIPREEVFVTTKLWATDQGRLAAREALLRSLAALELEYVDLYLQHWPHPLREESWETMEEARDEGLVRSIGVGNFVPRHLDTLGDDLRHRPVVNQFELTPFLYRTRAAMVERCRADGIVITAYAPLTCGQRLDEPALVAVAAAHGRTPAQVLLRWALQHGIAVVPRSRTPARIQENAALFDFALTDDEMAILDGLDDGFRVYDDPSDLP